MITITCAACVKTFVTDELTISDRRKDSAELIARKGFMLVAELVQILGVSESTVRRDLEILEQQGSVRRIHGGAVSLAEPPASRLAYADRQGRAVEEKRAIAAEIARRIADNQTVILDGGTTCYHVVEALAGRRVCVVTNSVPIAGRLAGEVDTEVTLIGGYLYPRTGVALGPMAEQMLSSLRAEQMVMSCAAVNPDGVFNVNEMMTAVERRMIEVSDRVILAVDHTKFGKRAIAPLCGWDEVDVVVSDAACPAEDVQRLRGRGITVVLAEARP